MPVPLEHRTQPDTAFFVHVAYAPCGAAHGSKADDSHVLNVEPRKREVRLLEQTILAAIAGAATDKCAHRCVPQRCGRLARMARAFACKIPIRAIAST